MSIPIRESTVGILAGNGTYPNLLAKSLKSAGFKIAAAGIKGHFQGPLPSDCEVEIFHLGALRKTAKYFKLKNANQIFFAGGIDRLNVWKTLRPDMHAVSLIPRALVAGDDTLLKAVAAKLEKLGLKVSDPRPYLIDSLAKEGPIAGPPIDNRTIDDIMRAGHAAKKIGAKDLGQAAVALRKDILGLEGNAGTDALISSCGKKGAVITKVSKPNQDMRFDIPSVGPSTVKTAHTAGLCAIGVEAGKVLLLEREALIETCNRLSISLVGIKLSL